MKKKRLSWVSLVLVLGHLAIIAGLTLSARAERRAPAARPAISILDELRD